MSNFLIQASAGRLIGRNVSAFVLGTVVLALLSLFRLLLPPSAVVSAVAVLALCLGWEIAAWYLHGVRLVFLGPEEMRIELGKGPDVRIILKKESKKIRVRRFLGESRVVIPLREPSETRAFPWRFKQSSRIVIRDGAFRKEEFERLIDAVSRWRLTPLGP
jgi:hypothetical protein